MQLRVSDGRDSDVPITVAQNMGFQPCSPLTFEETRVKTLRCAVLVLMPVASAAAQANSRPLFFIARSKNANIVQYDARIDTAGKIAGASPVTAYWIMNAQAGQREGLTWFEDKFAYGFDVRANPDSGNWTLIMRAYRQRPVTIRQTPDTVRAEVMISGRAAAFERMFILARDRRLRTPKVEHVDLFGRDLETGEVLCERIVPDKAEGLPCNPTR